ncbi:Protein kinase domain-containing protein ppk32 [Coemansia sp. RSA 485]|nr:Protein kinase domain-containing protein ppk32 [Coemansia sp. RSA 485]KAJ2603409.1 Protein kinase domain-containing protein ppk32 [Coemansia sp. RSA 1721]
MDGYLSKLRGLASSAANAVQSKIGREYEADFSGPAQAHSGLWSLYRSRRRGATNQPVTIWVFDKQRFFDRGINRQTMGAHEQTLILERLKTEAAKLTRLRHPSVLQVMEPLEDTRATLAFVTEPVVASLSDLCTGTNKCMVDGDEYELDELELQKGLLQVSQALQFLHRDANLVHGNLQPSAVVVNAKGDWKLAGLGFAQPAANQRRVAFEYDYGMPAHTQQTLAFMAPELVSEGSHTPMSDVFSLGCLAYALHNRGTSPIDCGTDPGAHRKAVISAQQHMRGLPDALVPIISRLLSADAANRMSLDEFQRSAYFDNILVSSLRYLEALAAQPDDQKIAFMQNLSRIIPGYPARVRRRKLLPMLLDQTNDHALLQFTLPNVFLVAEDLSQKEFESLAGPGLLPVYSLAGLTTSAIVVLLKHASMMQAKIDAKVFGQQVMPLVYNSLVSSDPLVQEQALDAVPLISQKLKYVDLRDHLLPRVQQLYARATILAHKVRALVCLQNMLNSLDKPTIISRILPMLKKTRTREPQVVMAMVSVYEYLGMEKLDNGEVAREVIPVLWAFVVETRLPLEEFDILMDVVKKISDKIKEGQRMKAEEIERIDRQTLLQPPKDTTTRDEVSLATGSGTTQGRDTLSNPLAQNSTTNNTKATQSNWEWDAPTSVEADDMFGSFANASVSSPVRSPQVSLKHTASGKLGAMKLGTTAATTAFGMTLPPPPPPPSTSLKTGAVASSRQPAMQPLSFGQSFGQPALAPLPRKQPTAQQKHIGGKTADLDDFDPFA